MTASSQARGPSPASDLAADLPDYYDELHAWTAADPSFQVYSGLETDTIHRFLHDAERDVFSGETIYRFIDPLMPANAVLRGLDAGCGYGGTCFRYLGQRAGHWTGITISPAQAAHARSLAAARGLTGRAAFLEASYMEPPAGPYDAIIAIESLIHATDPAAAISALAAVMAAKGRFIIVDDMPAPDASAEDDDLLARFRTAWRCPVMPDAAAIIRCAQAAGLRLIADHDLTGLMRPRTEADLDATLADLTARRPAKDEGGFARLADAEIGGLHLERLHRRGAVVYRLLAFEKD